MAHQSGMENDLRKTSLFAIHQRLGASFVPFAGYEMPVQFPNGIMHEHKHTRTSAGLFDVSHMGQIIVRPKSGAVQDAATALEALVPMDILDLPAGRQRYALLTNQDGGILDDCMVANLGDALMIVVNAACKQTDFQYLHTHLSPSCHLEMLEDHALIALQGPKAEKVLAALAPKVVEMRFMDVRAVSLLGVQCHVSRSGYTGEDGYEISIPVQHVEAIVEALLDHSEVAAIGLGARDSLRLEAGLCLYGSDMDTNTTPVEAALEWSIQKCRRTGGSRAGGFPGADVILKQLDNGAAKRRVGLRPETRMPVRGGSLYADESSTVQIGTVTSGGFGPSVDWPVAMGYLPIDLTAPKTLVFAEVRGKRVPVRVEPLQFYLPTYKR